MVLISSGLDREFFTVCGKFVYLHDNISRKSKQKKVNKKTTTKNKKQQQQKNNKKQQKQQQQNNETFNSIFK